MNPRTRRALIFRVVEPAGRVARGSVLRWIAPGLLTLGAVFGPLLVGPAEPPSVAPSAVQLLPPGTLVQEVRIADGGFARALEVQLAADGLRLRSASGWRTFPWIEASDTPRAVRVWLGTDHQGRSLLARLVHGARYSLVVAGAATLIAVLFGSAFGLGSALLPARGRRLLEIVNDGLLGLPRLLLLLVLGVALRGVGFGTSLAIGLASWMEVARLVQAESLRLSAVPFIAAAKVSGAGMARLAFRHLLPNLAPILAVILPLVATEAILLEATLSFLGVAGGRSVSWGRIIADGQRLLPSGWWIVVFPGLLLCATALAIHGLARPGPARSRRLSTT